MDADLPASSPQPTPDGTVLWEVPPPSSSQSDGRKQIRAPPPFTCSVSTSSPPGSRSPHPHNRAHRGQGAAQSWARLGGPLVQGSWDPQSSLWWLPPSPQPSPRHACLSVAPGSAWAAQNRGDPQPLPGSQLPVTPRSLNRGLTVRPEGARPEAGRSGLEGPDQAPPTGSARCMQPPPGLPGLFQEEWRIPLGSEQ